MAIEQLHLERLGVASVDDEGADRLVLVHGFTQTARCWGPFGADLTEHHDVWAVDAPGHGRSSEVRADLVEGAALLGAAGGPATYVGYSMGGRLTLHLALAQPELVERLVLIGATPGIEDDTERAGRRAADDALADHLEDIGVDAFLDEWLAQPLFAGLSPAAAGLGERRRNTVAGLASSLRWAGTGTQEPLWEDLRRLTMPVLLVVGADDTKFLSIAERMADRIGPTATIAAVPAAGHSAHLERPVEAAEAVRAWLAAHPVP